MSPQVEIVALSPLKTATLVWRPEAGAAVLTVVCKATYALEPGESPLAEVQDDVNERDLHAMNNEALGLHSASDLVPFKPRADVTLVGRAYSPPGELSRSLVARLEVGSVDKKVGVHADRFLRRSGRIEDEKFFSKMALGYDNAPGGEGTDNPAGMSMTGERDDKGRLPLPNLQHPDERIEDVNSRPSPIGFGPLPARWPARRGKVASYSGPWLEGDYEASELPEGWNWAFFNVAPPDQQLREIAPDQVIRLEHLHPEEPKLETRLPGMSPVVYAQRSGGAQRLDMRADTLWIDTNRLVQTVTWRGQLPLASVDEALRLIVTFAKAGEELDWDAAWRLAEAKGQADGDGDDTWDLAGEDDNRKTIARPRVVDPSEPGSGRPQTSPVPLVPGGDHMPNWLPRPAGSNPGSGPISSGNPPLSGRAVSVGPLSSSGEPVSTGAPPASGLTFDVALNEGEAKMLRDLCQAMGYDAVEMIKHALREAHRHRFGDD